MNKNTKWIIAAVLALALIVAAVVIFGGGQQDQQVNPTVTSNTAPNVVSTEAPADATEAPSEAPSEAPAEVTAEPEAGTTSAETTAEPEAQDDATEAPTEPTEVPAEATNEPEAQATANPKAVMATVNGSDVLREDIDLIYSNLVTTYAQYGYDTSDATFAAAMQAYAVEYAVQLKLMEQKAIENGFDQFTDEEKAEIEKTNAEEWASIVDMYVSYYGGVTEESTEDEKAAARVSVLAMLESMGYTEAVLLENAMQNAKLDKVQAMMVEGANVTDEEVKALFDQYVAADESSYKDNVAMYEYMTQYYGQTAYYTPEGYRGITHILLDVDDDLLSNYQTLSAKLEEQQEAEEKDDEAEATDTPEADTTAEPETPVTQADVDAAYKAIMDSVQPTIDEIKQKLADGVPFADLVAEYGTDPGMQQEPNKTNGYSVHMDSILWDPAFVKAAFSVDNVGDVAEPVVGNYGVHIVQYTRDVPAGAVEFTDELKSAMLEEALSQKESELFNTTMDAWMQEANVTYSTDAQSMLDAAKTEE